MITRVLKSPFRLLCLRRSKSIFWVTRVRMGEKKTTLAGAYGGLAWVLTLTFYGDEIRVFLIKTLSSKILSFSLAGIREERYCEVCR